MSEIKEYGVIDEAKGITIEPAYNIVFTRKVGLEDYKKLSALFDKYELPGATIKPDGSGMEIINLTVYNKNYEKFIERVKNLIKDKDSSGFYKSVRRNVREVRHIALTRQDGITTYGRIRSDFQAVPTKTEEIAKLMKVLGDLSKLSTATPVRKKLRAEVKPAIRQKRKFKREKDI